MKICLSRHKFFSVWFKKIMSGSDSSSSRMMCEALELVRVSRCFNSNVGYPLRPMWKSTRFAYVHTTPHHGQSSTSFFKVVELWRKSTLRGKFCLNESSLMYITRKMTTILKMWAVIKLNFFWKKIFSLFRPFIYILPINFVRRC